MKSIKEKSEEHAPYTREDSWEKTQRCIIAQTSFVAGANYVLEEIEKELTRRMLEDYNQGAEEDEVAQGCMATMIMFARNLKEK